MQLFQVPQHSKRILADIFDLSEELQTTFTKKIYNTLTELAQNELSDFFDTLERDGNGNITENSNTAWVAKIAALEAKLIAAVNSPKYDKPISDYLLDFGKVKELNKQLHENINGITNFQQLEADLQPKQKYIMQKVMYELKQGGIKSIFVEPTKQVLLNAITFGQSISTAKKNISALYASATDTTSTRINSYIGQITRDAIYTYNGAINETIATAYGLDGIAYLGGVVADSRPFCTHYHGAEIAKKDLKDILTKYLGSETLSQGMYKVSPSDYEANFLIYRGGWNCRHVAIPIRL